jgi:hypothetical protein
MGGAYQAATLLRNGAIGLVIVLAIALIVAGTLIREEKRKRFLLWCTGSYLVLWTLFVLYNTVLLTRHFLKMLR